jgi:hypothetical protein
MKLCPVIPEICRGHVHVPKKERKIIIIIRRRNGEKNLPHTTFPPTKNLLTFYMFLVGPKVLCFVVKGVKVIFGGGSNGLGATI